MLLTLGKEQFNQITESNQTAGTCSDILYDKYIVHSSWHYNLY